jgi:uncharacterized DUF497 family protein
VEFEFDDQRSLVNQAKHGIGFDSFPPAVRARRRWRSMNAKEFDRKVDALDREAKRLGVTRQSIIKVWLAERLERKAS